MSEDVIDDNMLNEIREQVKVDLPEYAHVKPAGWESEEKTPFMFIDPLGKLSTELHGKSVA